MEHQLFIRPIWDDEARQLESSFSGAAIMPAHCYAWEYHKKELRVNKQVTLCSREHKYLFLGGS